MRALAVLALLAATAHAQASDQVALVGVTGTLSRATATFAVRYRVELAGPMQFADSVELPASGIVIGATVEAGGERHVLELLPVARVEQRFATLSAAPPARRRGWGVRVHAPSGGRVTVELAVPRPTTVALELAITAPTCFVRDWRYVAVPESWVAVAPSAARVPPALVRELEDRCDEHATGWLRFASPELAARSSGVERIGATASVLDLGDRHVAKLELALASKLTEVPADLATAIVVDASRSMTEDELEAQRALVASYLAVAGGRVQLIAFARTARPLLPGWMAAPHATPRIARALAGLALGNGSNVDAALREAAAWLGRVRGTRRIVLVTDERLATRFEESVGSLRALVPNILVNVAVVGDRELARDDDATLAPLAKATRGIAVRGHGDATILARPIALDHVAIATPGWTELRSDRSAPFAFAEGTSCTWLGFSTAPPQPITIAGLLWNTPVTRVVTPDGSRGLELARELAASSSLEDDDVQARVELAALAVSRHWALLATWGGTGGYADAYGTGTGYGASCRCEGGGGLGHGSGHGEFATAGDLKPQLVRAIAACRPDRPIDVTLETTFAEIVDVGVDVQPAADALRRCVEDAVWNTWLDMPRGPPRLRRTIRVH